LIFAGIGHDEPNDLLAPENTVRVSYYRSLFLLYIAEPTGTERHKDYRFGFQAQQVKFIHLLLCHMNDVQKITFGLPGLQ